MNLTIENLAKAFVGESMARNKYTFFAKIAIKEGFEKVANVFLETAEQEKEHAKWNYKLLEELKTKYNVKTDITINSDVHVVLGNTLENLKSAIDGEHYETSKMYPEFADIADKEGFPDIAKRLRAIAIAEKHHEGKYQKLYDLLKDNAFFKRTDLIYWACIKCGYLHKGKEPPKECPSCGHESNYFERQNEDY